MFSVVCMQPAQFPPGTTGTHPMWKQLPAEASPVPGQTESEELRPGPVGRSAQEGSLLPTAVPSTLGKDLFWENKVAFYEALMGLMCCKEMWRPETRGSRSDDRRREGREVELTQKPAWVKRTPVPPGQTDIPLCQGPLRPSLPSSPVWARRLWVLCSPVPRLPLGWVSPSGRP